MSDIISIWIPIRIIRDYSTFTVNHNFKVSPSSRRVSGAKAICKDTAFLTRITLCLLLFYNFTYT
jgi:hypothetical protein